MTADGQTIEYTSRAGYTGKICGEKALVIHKDGREVFHTANRNIETIGELKQFVDSFPAFMDMLTQTERKGLVEQVGAFRVDFIEHFNQIPRHMYCTSNTLAQMEAEYMKYVAGYISGNPSPSVYGMIVRHIDDGEIIIESLEGRCSRYRLDTTTQEEEKARFIDALKNPPRRALFSERTRRAGMGDAE